jgi:hypothetical protein
MKFSMTGQENGDFLIQATKWVSLTIHIKITHYFNKCLSEHFYFVISNFLDAPFEYS